MSATSLSQAKHAMRSAIGDLLDPPPDKGTVKRIWEHFGSCCAYCERPVIRAARDGHIDHLVPRAKGGGNGADNCVLACRECNGNEKRDLGWEQFLASKCVSEGELGRRRKQIEAWIKCAPNRKNVTLGPEARQAKEAIERTVVAFEREFQNLRLQVRSGK